MAVEVPPSPRLWWTKRGVAQLASVLAWGARGRVFESHHPDNFKELVSYKLAGSFNVDKACKNLNTFNYLSVGMNIKVDYIC
jgi:hypothetical protein